MTSRSIVAFIHSYMPDGKLDPFMQGVLDGFVQVGVDVHLIKTNALVWNLGDTALARQYDEWKILDFIEKLKPDFVFTSNRGGIPRALIDFCPCPILTWLVDITPFMHHGGTRADLYGANDVVITSSSHNVTLLEKEYPFLKGRVFYQPFATIPTDFEEQGGCEKDIPVSFVGSCFASLQPQLLIKEIADNNELYDRLKTYVRLVASSFESNADEIAAQCGLTDFFREEGVSVDAIKAGIANLVSSGRRIRLLESLAGLGLHLFGTRNWIDMMSVSLPLFYAFDPTPIDTRAKLVKIYQRSKISVNISHQQAMGGLPYRIFDIMASSSLLLAGEESRLDLELLFGHDMPLPLYRDPEHARELADYYLNNEAERQVIVARCNELIKNNFDFVDRTRRMFAFVRPDLTLEDSAPKGEVALVDPSIFCSELLSPLFLLAKKLPRSIKKFAFKFIKSFFTRKMLMAFKQRFLESKTTEQAILGDVAAVVVTFNSDESFAERLASYASQVRSVYVVDNSTDEQASARIRAAVEAVSNARLLRQNNNLGLAAAQNLGIDAALEGNAPDWILLMDDDSLADPHMVRTMQMAWARYHNRERVGMIVPRVIDRKTNREARLIVSEGLLRVKRRVCKEYEALCDTALTAIASGSLINTKAWKQAGALRSDYFIDYVDIEYALRLRRLGWKIIVPRLSVLRHSLGQKSEHRFAGKTFVVTNHPAWRRYTIMRNRIDVWKRYFLRFPTYVVYDALVAVFETLKIAAFEADRETKMAEIKRGWRDGWRGRFPSPFAGRGDLSR